MKQVVQWYSGHFGKTEKRGMRLKLFLFTPKKFPVGRTVPFVVLPQRPGFFFTSKRKRSRNEALRPWRAFYLAKLFGSSDGNANGTQGANGNFPEKPTTFRGTPRAVSFVCWKHNSQALFISMEKPAVPVGSQIGRTFPLEIWETKCVFNQGSGISVPKQMLQWCSENSGKT